MIVKIRPLVKEDAIFSWSLRNDESIWKYVDSDTPLPATYETELKAYEKMLEGRDNCKAIEVDGEFVGVVKVRNHRKGSGELWVYILRKDMWGRGIATRALNMIIKESFESGRYDMLYRCIDLRNAAMLSIAFKQGFVMVGKTLSKDDVARLEITRTEWKQRNNMTI